MGISSQQHIKNLSAPTVADAEAATYNVGDIVSIADVGSSGPRVYAYIASAASYARDGLQVLNTATGGDTRLIEAGHWLAQLVQSGVNPGHYHTALSSPNGIIPDAVEVDNAGHATIANTFSVGGAAITDAIHTVVGIDGTFVQYCQAYRVTAADGDTWWPYLLDSRVTGNHDNIDHLGITSTLVNKCTGANGLVRGLVGNVSNQVSCSNLMTVAVEAQIVATAPGVSDARSVDGIVKTYAAIDTATIYHASMTVGAGSIGTGSALCIDGIEATDAYGIWQKSTEKNYFGGPLTVDNEIRVATGPLVVTDDGVTFNGTIANSKIRDISTATGTQLITDYKITLMTSVNNVALTLLAASAVPNQTILVRHYHGSTGSNAATITNTISGQSDPHTIEKDAGWIAFHSDEIPGAPGTWEWTHQGAIA